MKKFKLITLLLFAFSMPRVSIGQLPNGMTQAGLEKAMFDFQLDADIIRLEHLLYWSELLEEYFESSGDYPLQNKIEDASKPLMVRIATKIQMGYLTPGSPEYMSQFDNNQSGNFQEHSVKEFVSVLERGLGRKIKEKYDIQKAPHKKTVGYYYFVTKDGYLIWGPCPTFGVSKISTLLMDGSTPTLNIASEGMKEHVFKALTRDELLRNRTFEKWRKRKLSKEKELYVRGLVEEFENDSKSE